MVRGTKEWIANDSARRGSFTRRRKGLFEHVRELSSFPDVESFMIIYRPDEKQPQVWPDIHEALRLVSKFNSVTDIKESNQRKEGIVKAQIRNTRIQLQKLHRENRKLEMNLILSDCLAGTSVQGMSNMKDLSCLAVLVLMKMNQIRKRMKVVKKKKRLVAMEAEEKIPVEEQTINSPTQTEMEIEDQPSNQSIETEVEIENRPINQAVEEQHTNQLMEMEIDFQSINQPLEVQPLDQLAMEMEDLLAVYKKMAKEKQYESQMSPEPYSTPLNCWHSFGCHRGRAVLHSA